MSDGETNGDARLRVPPHDMDAEQSVLGALLLAPARLDTVSRVLTPASFYIEAHARVYAMMLTLHERGEPIDLVTMTRALRDSREIERVGGVSWMAELFERTPTAANVEAHSAIVARLATQRAIREAGMAIADRASDLQSDLAALIDDAETRITEATAAARTEIGWGPLVPLDHARDLPELPMDTLSPWVGEIAADLALAYQVPLELPAMYALALLSGTLAGKYVVEVRSGWCMPPVLYVLVALPPSERKSPVITALAGPLRTWEREQAIATADARRRALVAVEQARARAEAALRAFTRPAKGVDIDALAETHRVAAQTLYDAEAAVPAEARLIVEYATPEALAERMADRGDRQIILSDEGAGVLAMTGRYARFAGADLDLLLKGYDGTPYTPARITRTARPMTAATLTIAIGAQPAAIIDLLRHAPEIRDRGLLARILTFLPVPRVGLRQIRPAPVRPPIAAEYSRRVRALLEVPDEFIGGRLTPRVLRFSREADDVIAALEARLEPELGHGGRHERIAAAAGKLAGNAARIAAVLHAADHAGSVIPAEVPLATAERAVRLTETCLPHTHALMDALAAPPELEGARRIAEWLRRHAKAVVSDREILRGTRGAVVLATAKERDAALQLLERHGYVRRPQQGISAARRPSPRWEVRPDWLGSANGREHGRNGQVPPTGPVGDGTVHFVHGLGTVTTDDMEVIG